MRRLLLSVLSVLALTPTLSADEKIDAKLLIGRWEPPGGKLGQIEFGKGGDATITTVATDGKETKFEGTYKVAGNTVAITLKVGDREAKDTLTVSKLTGAVLVSTDGKNKERTLVRIKDR